MYPLLQGTLYNTKTLPRSTHGSDADKTNSHRKQRQQPTSIFTTSTLPKNHLQPQMYVKRLFVCVVENYLCHVLGIISNVYTFKYYLNVRSYLSYRVKNCESSENPQKIFDRKIVCFLNQVSFNRLMFSIFSFLKESGEAKKLYT